MFAGLGEASIDSPTRATGSGEVDGHFVGLSARIRDVTTAFLSAEAALPVKLNNGMELRPFIGAHTLFTDADQVTMSLPGGSASFATDGDESLSGLRLGTELHLSRSLAPWRLR